MYEPTVYGQLWCMDHLFTDNCGVRTIRYKSNSSFAADTEADEGKISSKQLHIKNDEKRNNLGGF